MKQRISDTLLARFMLMTMLQQGPDEIGHRKGIFTSSSKLNLQRCTNSVI